MVKIHRELPVWAGDQDAAAGPGYSEHRIDKLLALFLPVGIHHKVIAAEADMLNDAFSKNKIKVIVNEWQAKGVGQVQIFLVAVRLPQHAPAAVIHPPGAVTY